MALLKALCWALIFILRIRFPPGTSLVTILTLHSCTSVYYWCLSSFLFFLRGGRVFQLGSMGSMQCFVWRRKTTTIPLLHRCTHISSSRRTVLYSPYSADHQMLWRALCRYGIERARGGRGGHQFCILAWLSRCSKRFYIEFWPHTCTSS